MERKIGEAMIECRQGMSVLRIRKCDSEKSTELVLGRRKRAFYELSSIRKDD